MVRNLLAFALAISLALLAGRSHRWLLSRAGNRRGGRGAGYVVAGMAYGTALGVLLALTNDGWHRTRTMLYETHTSLLQGLTMGVVIGALAGLVWFLQSERRDIQRNRDAD